MKIILFCLTALSAIFFAGCDVKDPIYDATYAIKVSNDGHGTGAAKVNDVNADNAVEGATVTITATPTGDYAFKQWVVVSGGATFSSATANPATFTMPAAAVEIKAEFEAVKRTVTMTNDGNGTATATPADAAAGQTVTITATPTGDYAFKQWVVVSGGATLSSATANPATFTMPAAAVEIKAEFEAVKRTVTMTNNGNGTAVAEPTNAVAGQTVTISATPTGGYAFKQWVIVSNNTTLTITAYGNATFTMPAEAVEIRAEFIALTALTAHNDVGSGAAADPWQIYKAAQLADLATVVNAGTDMAGKYFKLMADISLSGYADWTPIGNSYAKPFRGNFDGNNKVISNLSMGSYIPPPHHFYGLFGVLHGGGIKDISVTGIIGPIRFDDSANVGAVIGHLRSGSVSNITVSVSITTTTTNNPNFTEVDVGGAIGASYIPLSASTFHVTPVISFEVDGRAQGRVGHNVGYCGLNGEFTTYANAGYDRNDPAITSQNKGASTLQVNGFR